jgi:MFS family permease
MTLAGARLRPTPALAPLMALGVVGSYFFMLVPVVESALVHNGIYTLRSAGLIGSAPLAGMFVGSIASALIIDRLPAKTGSAFALLGLLFADLLSAWAFKAFPVLLGAQFVAGCSGVVLMSLAYTAISRTANPDRHFAMFIACQMSAGALATQALQRFAVSMGPVGVFGVLTLVAGSALSLLLLVTNGPPAHTLGHKAMPLHPSLRSKHSLSILTAQIFFGAGVMLIWSCAASIGESQGLTTAKIANALTLSLVTSVAGALCASWVAKRLPLNVWLLVGSIAIGGGAVLAVLPLWSGLFYLGVMIFGFGWNFLPPFQLGVAAAIDPRGRLAVLNVALVKLGYAFGTAAAGWLAETTYHYLANAAAAVLCFAAALVTTSYSAGAQRTPAEVTIPT